MKQGAETMRNYLHFGPVSVRISRKHLAWWGFPLLRFGGVSLFSRSNDGGYILASYHPKKSLTWHWSVTVLVGKSRAYIGRSNRRQGQWHDYYWLPFGLTLLVGQQDYHQEIRRPE